MTMKKIAGKKGAVQRPTIRVGDLVQVKFGDEDVKGRIVENRGRIGVKGRNLYRIALHMDAGEPMSIELPAERIHVIRPVSAAKKTQGSGVAKVRNVPAPLQ